MITDINSENRLVQKTFAHHLQDVLGRESVYAHNDKTFGPTGTLGRAREREVILVRDTRRIAESLVEKITIGDKEIDITFSYLPSSEEVCKCQQRLGTG
jgi:hypothetical protein